MTPKEFVALQSKLGLNIIEAGGVNWVVSDNGIAINTPSIEAIDCSSINISEVVSKGAKAALFIVDSCDNHISNSAEYIFQGDSYTLDIFKGKIRNQIKKGLKSCVIKQPTHKDLKTYGLNINREILLKQSRDVSYLTNDKKWYHYSQTLLSSQDVHCYGAYIDDILIGYVFFIKVGNKYYIYHPYSTREFSKYAPMNALLYTAMNDFLSFEDHIKVTYGLSSFYAKPQLDHFKKGMLFMQVPVCRALMLPKYYSIILNKVGLFVMKKFSCFRKFDVFYEKYSAIYSAHRAYQCIAKKKV